MVQFMIYMVRKGGSEPAQRPAAAVAPDNKAGYQ